MNCRYRAGDALVGLAVYLVMLVLTLRLAIAEHWAWSSLTVLLVGAMGLAAYVNKHSREREKIAAIRRDRQAALGVPLDE